MAWHPSNGCRSLFGLDEELLTSAVRPHGNADPVLALIDYVGFQDLPAELILEVAQLHRLVVSANRPS